MRRALQVNAVATDSLAESREKFRKSAFGRDADMWRGAS
jgi:hypothetical protein